MMEDQIPPPPIDQSNQTNLAYVSGKEEADQMPTFLIRSSLTGS